MVNASLWYLTLIQGQPYIPKLMTLLTNECRSKDKILQIQGLQNALHEVHRAYATDLQASLRQHCFNRGLVPRSVCCVLLWINFLISCTPLIFLNSKGKGDCCCVMSSSYEWWTGATALSVWKRSICLPTLHPS